MLVSLNALVARIRTSTIDLSGIATELFVGSRKQEEAVAEFSSSTNEITAAAREISATSEELAGAMASVNELAKQAASLASSGQDSLHSAKEAMGRLEKTAGSISHRLGEIHEGADGVGVAVTTIEKVADRTNMLSLNAAIEAEKAGDERTGFALVAREVRRLADQTGSATGDIGKIVQELQVAVHAGVTEMDSFSAEVASSAADVQRIGNQLQGVIDRVRRLSVEFERVHEGTQLQSKGAGQIRDALVGLSDGVQQTDKTLADFQHASEHLQTAVAELREEVAGIRTADATVPPVQEARP
jgi:methyl-accepting chemotaxis protein WspA